MTAEDTLAVAIDGLENDCGAFPGEDAAVDPGRRNELLAVDSWRPDGHSVCSGGAAVMEPVPAGLEFAGERIEAAVQGFLVASDRDLGGYLGHFEEPLADSAGLLAQRWISCSNGAELMVWSYSDGQSAVGLGLGLRWMRSWSSEELELVTRRGAKRAVQIC